MTTKRFSKSIKYGLLIWATVFTYYLVDRFLLFPITNQVFNGVSPLIVFLLIVVGGVLVLHSALKMVFTFLKKFARPLNSQNRLSKLIRHGLRYSAIPALGGIVFVLDMIFGEDYDNSTYHHSIDNDSDPIIRDYGKPSGVSHSSWALKKTEITEQYDLDHDFNNDKF